MAVVEERQGTGEEARFVGIPDMRRERGRTDQAKRIVVEVDCRRDDTFYDGADVGIIRALWKAATC